MVLNQLNTIKPYSSLENFNQKNKVYKALTLNPRSMSWSREALYRILDKYLTLVEVSTKSVQKIYSFSEYFN